MLGMTSTPFAAFIYSVPPLMSFLKRDIAAVTLASISPFVFASATGPLKASAATMLSVATRTLPIACIFMVDASFHAISVPSLSVFFFLVNILIQTQVILLYCFFGFVGQPFRVAISKAKALPYM